MMFARAVSRRAVLAALGIAACYPLWSTSAIAASTEMIVARNPGCGCCGKWAEKMRQAGFRVRMADDNKITDLRKRLGVPHRLASCHTAQVGGYVIEGHVPVAAVQRLLSERPAATGLAVPGMPAGSPGMEGPQQAVDYDVILFSSDGEKVYGRYNGERRLG